MEQEKNKNGVNLLLIFAIVILSMLCILFATNTISFKANKKCNMNDSNDVLNANTGEVKEVASNTTIDKYLGKWLLAGQDYSNIVIKKNNDNTGYNIDILVNKEADFKDLELTCANNSGACYFSGDVSHNYSIMMANDTVIVLPSYGTAGYWIFAREQVASNSNSQNNENVNNEMDNAKNKTLKLTKENESFDIDKLHLDFKGVEYKTDEKYYQYLLSIKYDGKDINNAFFNDKNKYRIWSHNYIAANFKVYKIDNVYILVSFIAKQCFCNEVMIFNTNGDVLKTFTTADVNINGATIKISTSDNGQCMGPDWESHVRYFNYTVNDTQLIEQLN